MSFAKCLRLFAPSVVRPRLYGSVLAAKTISGNRFFSRTATTTQAKLVVTEGGNRLQAVWSSDSGATPSNYHAVWLRHNCQCPTCLSEYNQQLVEAHELDPHVKISDVKLLSGLLCTLTHITPLLAMTRKIVYCTRSNEPAEWNQCVLVTHSYRDMCVCVFIQTAS